ncbi:MAG: BrnT family toxin [Phycisphaerales bacterium]|nr:BrnT family toxin [Phycisphaerales bacterium]
MTARNYIWDERKAAANLAKHGVEFEEARQAFEDPRGVLEFDTEHSDSEDRFVLLAISPRLRILFVVHAEEDEGFTRIISARRATKQERIRYEQANS